VKPYNEIGAQYGLKGFDNFIELIEGDHVLLADIPHWVNLPKIRPNLHYIGPLPYRRDIPVPKEVVDISKDKPIIYFAMGSSGKPKFIREIIEGFDGKSYRVIAPIKSLVKELNITIPSNVLVTGFVPAHKVNPMADISVLHGGQNTVMQACLSGTPIVGIGNHPEQQANLDACVRKGFAIRISRREVTAFAVLMAIDKLLHNKGEKEKVKTFQKELMKWDDPVNAARFLYETFGK